MSPSERSAASTDSGQRVVAELFRRYRSSGDRQVRDEIIIRHRWIAHYCAKRFANRGEPLDDLVQVAQLGVLKAVERYDPDYGVEFAGFAIPTVTGELRRHFRDATWLVHVGRRPKDLSVTVRHAVEVLQQELQRSPTVEEVASHLRVPEHDVLTALEALEANRTRPLQAVTDDEDDHVTVRSVGTDDGELDADRLAVRRAIDGLPPRDRQIVILRFYEGLTQAEIAHRVGSSQVQVSRELRRIFRRLGPQLELVS